jgi:hypothetical protein
MTAPKAGETIKSHHLLILCSDPLADGRVVSFNLTTKDWDSELTCVVQVGEHPYVIRESVIAYRFGELLEPNQIERLRILAPQDYGPVSQKLLLRIQQGAVTSKETPGYLKKIMKDVLTPPATPPAGFLATSRS